MRVLMLSDFGPPLKGGLESHVAALATGLTNLGIEVHLGTVAPCVLADKRITLHTVKTAASSLVSYADPARPFHIPMSDPRARRGIAALIEYVQPDLLHAHTWIAASVPRRDGIPLVLTAHDYSTICQLRTLLRPSFAQCEGPGFLKCISCGRGRYGLARSAALTSATLIGRANLKPDASIAVSQHVADRLRPYVDAAVHVITNFVDQADLIEDADPVDVPPRLPLILFAGDPQPNKGLQHLIDIWNSDNAPAARLLIATTRPLDHALPAGVSARELSRRQLFVELRQARALAVPSLWEDPCPTVVLEAFCAGTPVVAYASGGIPELISDGVEGLLVRTGDVGGLRAALEKVLTNDELASALGSSARTAAANFSVQVGAQSTLALYESVLARSERLRP
jgi:glycogen(starch) synthase